MAKNTSFAVGEHFAEFIRERLQQAIRPTSPEPEEAPPLEVG